jgi:hypothetical protein
VPNAARNALAVARTSRYRQQRSSNAKLTQVVELFCMNKQIRVYCISYRIQVVSSQSSRHSRNTIPRFLLPSVHYVFISRSHLPNPIPYHLYREKSEIQSKSLNKQVYTLSSTSATPPSLLSPQQVIQEGSAPEYQSAGPYL